MFTLTKKKVFSGLEVTIEQQSIYPLPWQGLQRPDDYYEQISTLVTFIDHGKKIQIVIPSVDQGENRKRVLKVTVDGKEYSFDQDGLDILDMNKTFDIPDMQKLINITVGNAPLTDGNCLRTYLPFFYMPEANYALPKHKSYNVGFNGHIQETNGDLLQLVLPYVNAMKDYNGKGIKRELYIPVVTFGEPHHWNVCILTIDEQDKPFLTYLETSTAGLCIDDCYFDFYKENILPQINRALSRNNYQSINKKDISFDVSKQFSQEGCGIAAAINITNLLNSTLKVKGSSFANIERERQANFFSKRPYPHISLEEDALRRVQLAFKLTAHNKQIDQLRDFNPEYIDTYRYKQEEILREIRTHKKTLKTKAEESFPQVRVTNNSMSTAIPVERIINKEQYQVSYSQLLDNIEQFNAHSKTLFASKNDLDHKEGEKGIELAKKLKELAIKFDNELKSPEKNNEIKQTRNTFKEALNQGYKEMDTHREYWKIIAANIAIAATGIGLLVIIGKYLHSDSMFFEQTNRQQKINQIKDVDALIENTLDLTSIEYHTQMF